MIKLTVTTKTARELVAVTRQVEGALREMDLVEGAVMLYSPHTTCGVTINEGADPDVRGDITRFMARLVPRDEPDFRHTEGNSDAHVCVTLVGSSVLLPVQDGRLQLGRWQTVFLAEFDGPRPRTLWLTGLPGG